MDIEKQFEKLYEDWKEIIEKKALKLRDLNFYPTPKKKGKKVSGGTAARPMAFGISRKGGSGPGKGYGSAKKAPIMMGDDIEEDLKLIAVSEDMCDLKRSDLGSASMQSAWDKKCGTGEKKKKHTISTPSLRGVYDKAEFDPFIEEALGEGYKDLPPHLQKLVKKIEKKQKDWNKQNPKAQIKTLVYNPETGKPDIEIKEKTMKLEDTVKEVLEGKKKKGAYEDNTNDKSDDGEGLDKVQPKAVKKKFKDRKDKDIDNDGDVDDSDKFLHKRRKAVSKAVSKEEKSYSKLFTTVMSLLRGK